MSYRSPVRHPVEGEVRERIAGLTKAVQRIIIRWAAGFTKGSKDDTDLTYPVPAVDSVFGVDIKRGR
jgi:hypothetical protein